MRTVHGVYTWRAEDIRCFECYSLATAYVLIKSGALVYNYNYPCGCSHSASSPEPRMTKAELALATLMLEEP